MMSRFPSGSSVFVDASAWIAAFYPLDHYYDSAQSFYAQLVRNQVRFFTTNWVAYEALTFLKNRAGVTSA